MGEFLIPKFSLSSSVLLLAFHWIRDGTLKNILNNFQIVFRDINYSELCSPGKMEKMLKVIYVRGYGNCLGRDHRGLDWEGVVSLKGQSWMAVTQFLDIFGGAKTELSALHVLRFGPPLGPHYEVWGFLWTLLHSRHWSPVRADWTFFTCFSWWGVLWQRAFRTGETTEWMLGLWSTISSLQMEHLIKWFLSKALHQEITRDNITKHIQVFLFVFTFLNEKIELSEGQGGNNLWPPKHSMNKKHKYCSLS